MNTKNPIPSLLAVAALAACSQPAPETAPPAPVADTTAKAERPALVAPANAKLTLVAAPPAAAFPEAALRLDTMARNEKDTTVHYTFGVTGFDLTAQTPDAPARGCANSPDGQHIHFILNNKPYIAEYKADFTEKAEPGNNVMLAFLSRSYHESLKNSASVVVREFAMPGSDGVPAINLEKDPVLFYSRPKGDYKQFDGEKMLLDFYLLNTNLEDQGYSVRATIDGETWIINKWDAYFIEGLALGQHTVRLELIDKDGKLVPGPFNDSGERTFNYLAS